MKLITFRMMDELIGQAAKTERQRLNFNIHESPSDPVQRLFIATGPSSYFRPHRHPGKSEFAIVLRGRFDILLFDANGVVTERVSAGPNHDTFALEIPQDIYHTWIPQAEASLFFEVKEGPFDPATASQFAPWSPAEGTAQVKAFQEKLRTIGPGAGIA